MQRQRMGARAAWNVWKHLLSPRSCHRWASTASSQEQRRGQRFHAAVPPSAPRLRVASQSETLVKGLRVFQTLWVRGREETIPAEGRVMGEVTLPNVVRPLFAVAHVSVLKGLPHPLGRAVKVILLTRPPLAALHRKKTLFSVKVLERTSPFSQSRKAVRGFCLVLDVTRVSVGMGRSLRFEFQKPEAIRSVFGTCRCSL